MYILCVLWAQISQLIEQYFTLHRNLPIQQTMVCYDPFFFMTDKIVFLVLHKELTNEALNASVFLFSFLEKL